MTIQFLPYTFYMVMHGKLQSPQIPLLLFLFSNTLWCNKILLSTWCVMWYPRWSPNLSERPQLQTLWFVTSLHLWELLSFYPSHSHHSTLSQLKGSLQVCRQGNKLSEEIRIKIQCRMTLSTWIRFQII